MPYDYHDANGYLAPGPTIPQWRAMRELLTGAHGMAFVETGSTDVPLQLADELDSDDPQVLKLKAAAERADQFLRLSNGTQQE